MDYIIQNGELRHHGVKGQRWGVRRFQNKDGSLTKAGKKRRDDTNQYDDFGEKLFTKLLRFGQSTLTSIGYRLAPVKFIAECSGKSIETLAPDVIDSGKKFIAPVTLDDNTNYFDWTDD